MKGEQVDRLVDAIGHAGQHAVVILTFHAEDLVELAGQLDATPREAVTLLVEHARFARLGAST